MYLKTLELQGFKSFADKTVIDLRPGIVGVVGPNGSGKSNIVEAVRWVLGEQSAKSMRGRKMEDVIFSGTKTRKPLGVAEVSIVLDNSDYGLPMDFTEVKVTRRLYRSGEGEYLINNKYVRLKDVHRLFDDSGIGGDGCAIIGQGRITELLGAKPEERRAIVEETAGVVKFRERKKEALRKIDAAENNLLRLDDIMGEIESRLTPLRRDAENAEKYLVYKQELDDISIALLAADGLAGRERLQALAAKEQEEQGALDELTASLLAGETTLAEQRAATSQLRDDCDEGRRDLHRRETEIQSAEGEIKSLAARVHGFEDMQALLTTELDELTAKSAELSAQLQEEEAAYAVVQAELAAISARMAEVESRRMEEEEDLLRAEQAMADLRAQAFEAARQGGNKKNDKLSLQKKTDGDRRRVVAIDGKLAEYAEQEAVLQARSEEIADFIDDVAVQEDELRARIRALEQETTDEKTKIEAKREEIVSQKLRVGAMESRLRTLEELVMKREGYYPGVKGVLEAKSKGTLSGVLGVVAELITVDRGFSVAIEAVLGGAIQNLVVTTGEDAAAAVAWLKREKRGIATFLPLDMLRSDESRPVPAKIENHPAFLGSAVSHLRCPQQVRPAIEHLLRNTLVFQNLEDGIRLAREFKGRFRIVTTEGDVVNSGGSVSGGSRDQKRGGILQRQSEIEELRRSIIDGGKKQKELEAQIEDIGERRENMKKQLASMDKKLLGLQAEKQSFDGEIKNIDTRREIYKRDEQALQEEREQLEGERQADAAAIRAFDAEILRLEKEEAALLSQISEQEQAFRTAKESETHVRDEHMEIQVSHAERRAAAENAGYRVSRLREEFSRNEAALTEKTVERDRQTGDREAALQRKGELLSAVLDQKRGLAHDSLAQEQREAEWNAVSQAADALEKELQKQRRQENEAREALHRTAVKKERLTLEQQQTEQRLLEEFNLTLDEALPKQRPDLTRTAAREQVKLLKQQIEVLGVINLGAIEEYQTVSERYEFLNGQRQDIVTAKESLARVIEQMDAIITEKFRETFEKLNASFQETFPGFFQGGYGELRLTEPDQLLTTGVEIIVQPPGKRLQHHGLLSGGEKALSGIALLFAILKVKPSPFYVLDEIDAALDDVNVSKFSAYLGQYGENSQFLVITHRQGTMESAAELYGVTMAEEGVSKTVSVRLVG